MIGNTPLVKEFWEKGGAADCPVIDMHGHMGSWKSIWFPRPDAEGMVYSMERANVRLLCFAHHHALFVPEVGNRAAIEAVRRFPNRLRAYLSLNPHYPEAIRRDLADFEKNADVFVGMKLLADYHRVPMTASPYEPALRFAAERKLLVLMHTWAGSAFNGPDVVRKLAPKSPGAELLCGHSFHGAWDEAVSVAREFPNIHLELTALLDSDRGAIEKFCEAGLVKRLLFGTDLPWFSQQRGIGAVLSAGLTDADRHDILHRNAERLLARFPGLAPGN